MKRWLQTGRGRLRLATWVAVALVLVLTVGGSIGTGEGMRMERAGAAENTPSAKATPVTPPPTIPLKPTSWAVPRPPSLRAQATPLPYPVPATATPRPTATPTQTRVPTPLGPPGPGLKVVYAERLGNTFAVWAARPSEPQFRRVLFTIDVPNGFGANIALAHKSPKAAFTALAPGAAQDYFAAQL